MSTVKESVKDRLTIISGVHHQRQGRPSTSIQSSGARLLETEEQPFDRTMQIGPEWTPLELGWLKDKPGIVRIEGLIPYRQLNLSKEEKEAELATVIQVTFDFDDANFPHCRFYHGMPFIFYPEDHHRVAIRCLTGPVDVRITILPR